MPHGPVLIVDDDERNVKLLRDVLRHEGFRTREASTGEAAPSRAPTRRQWS
jgi:CheY-like chemotaxis protein